MYILSLWVCDLLECLNKLSFYLSICICHDVHSAVRDIKLDNFKYIFVCKKSTLNAIFFCLSKRTCIFLYCVVLMTR